MSKSAKSGLKPGSKSRSISRRAQKVLFPNYGPRDLAFEKGEGSYLIDADGNRYLDCLSGIAVTSLGHANPVVAKAIADQAATLVHTSNLYLIEPQVKLAELLTKNSFADKAFFCNSGAEAVEGAIKLARRWGTTNKGKNCTKIVVAEGGFHGRTLGALSATPKEKYQEGFGPLVEGFKRAPFGDIAAFKKAITKKTCAVLIEPIQGEGGVNVASAKFFKELRRLCDDNRVLLIFDEVQVGMGRLGTLFGYQHVGVEPDVLTLAKALGNGFPIGAVLSRGELAELMTPGSHGTTFGGNFLATTAAIAAFGLLSKKSTLANCNKQGTILRNGLEELAGKYKGRIREIRGAGLLVGCELSGEAAPVLQAAREQGVLLGTAGPKVIRFAPSLLIKTSEIKQALAALDKALAATAESA
ncbi:MAG: aspartate aminotransferase family protein [Chrysiogenetes bacterium]|nr:aspartate aminotransferase family protein [Chrysiogenetes bacterium]